MKSYVVLCALICVAGCTLNAENDFPRRPPRYLINRCARRHDIDDAMLVEIKSTKSFLKTHDVQCFAACLVDNSGIVGSNGKVDIDFENSAPGQKCNNWSGEDICEMSANILSCLFQNDFMTMGSSMRHNFNYLQD